MMGHRDTAETAAVSAVIDLMLLPVPEVDFIGMDGTFNPWEIFPSLYGSYSQAFDDLAIGVLEDLRDGTYHRDDLASEMLREMLCTADLCDYGSSPRTCFPTLGFKRILPDLIARWREYSAAAWA